MRRASVEEILIQIDIVIFSLPLILSSATQLIASAQAPAANISIFSKRKMMLRLRKDIGDTICKMLNAINTVKYLILMLFYDENIFGA